MTVVFIFVSLLACSAAYWMLQHFIKGDDLFKAPVMTAPVQTAVPK